MTANLADLVRRAAQTAADRPAFLFQGEILTWGQVDAAVDGLARGLLGLGLEAGDRVTHDSFGMGTVVALEGVAEKAVASIDFGSEGVKRLLLRYAPVTKL